MTNYAKTAGILLIFVFIACLIISNTFNIDFVEKHFDRDNRIGEHVDSRVSLFQKQMLTVGLFLFVAGLLTLIFSNKINSFFTEKENRVFYLLLALLAILFIFLAGEITIRALMMEKIDAEYGHGPGGFKFQKEVQLNSLGSRDVEHKVEKNDGTFRILIYGDSPTLGFGIKNTEDTYPRLLQKKLDQAYGENRFEVISRANFGYSTIDEVRALRSNGMNYSPDLIILGYFVNDPEGPGSRLGFEKLFYYHYTYPYEIGDWLYTRSYFYYYLESRLKMALSRAGKEEQPYEDYVIHLYSDSNPSFKLHSRYLAAFINTGIKNNIPVVVANIPRITEAEQNPYQYASDYSKNISESNGALYLDLRSYFSGYSPDEVRVSYMDSHINELGHEIIAQALLDFLEEKQLLENDSKK